MLQGTTPNLGSTEVRCGTSGANQEQTSGSISKAAAGRAEHSAPWAFSTSPHPVLSTPPVKQSEKQMQEEASAEVSHPHSVRTGGVDHVLNMNKRTRKRHRNLKTTLQSNQGECTMQMSENPSGRSHSLSTTPPPAPMQLNQHPYLSMTRTPAQGGRRRFGFKEGHKSSIIIELKYNLEKEKQSRYCWNLKEDVKKKWDNSQWR